MKKDNLNSSLVFWDTAKVYLYNYLLDVRKASPNTTAAYQSSLNHYIDYLERHRKCVRKNIAFADFNRDSIKAYMAWMKNDCLLAAKTCNLRLTAIRSLLEYASNEYSELMSYYLSVCSVKNIKSSGKPIEFFEPLQMKALLSAPHTTRKTERRNQMMLILMYDTAVRVSELLNIKVNSLHLNSRVPYIMICGKGRKYRNIPLMDKTHQHLNRYLKEFHDPLKSDCALFYAITHGEQHPLSVDTMEVMVKRYTNKCISTGIEMPANPHCHMIRKTRAMDLYQNGVPLTHIQQLLGHEDLSTTSGFYAFATLETLSKSMEKVNGGQSVKKWNNKETMAKIYRL